jgi:uncharacterized protein YdhG (YjbR/CyaY superfamily)
VTALGEKFATVDDYVRSLPPAVRGAVEEVRGAIREAAPGGDEVISYNIPTLKRGGRSVVHFAGWKGHVSLYPMPDGDADLQRELAAYSSGKGTLKFPLTEPMPLELVRRVVAELDRKT